MIAQSPRDFAALIYGARQRRPADLAELMNRYGKPLRRAAKRLIGRPLQAHIDAADLLQELQLILWSGFVRGTYEPATPSHFLALARTILLGCVSRHWRAVKAMTITVKQRLDVIIADSPVPVRRDQGEPVSTVDFADSARRILDQLDRVDRRLVEMRLQGHSTAEAARELGVDAGCLRVRLRRLRQRLCDKGLVEQPIASSS